MDGNEYKTKENIHNNKGKLKINWDKKLNTTHTKCKYWYLASAPSASTLYCLFYNIEWHNDI